MVSYPQRRRDYEFVILLCGWRVFGLKQFTSMDGTVPVQQGEKTALDTSERIPTMKHQTLSAIAVVLTALAAGQAFAADTAVGKTREQVKAELAEAVRTGNVLANDDTGRLLREVFPGSYPAPAATQGLTREQVKAELADAIRTGNIVAGGETGQRLNEQEPYRYPAVAQGGQKSRAEVRAELVEAVRLGAVLASGDDGRLLNEVYPQLYPRVQ